MLNPKQQRFCEYYVASGNATDSAIKAGYSEKNARITGAKLLTLANIKTTIRELMEKEVDARIMSANEILHHLSEIARGTTSEEVVTTVAIGAGLSEVRKVEKRVGEKERLKALELLGKRYLLFTEKVSVEGAIPVIIGGEHEIKE